MLIILDMNWIKLAGSGVQWWKFLVTIDPRLPWQHGINVRFGVLTAVSVGAVICWVLRVDGGYKLLQNVGTYIQNYTASHTRELEC